jgi:hypothetical protein
MKNKKHVVDETLAVKAEAGYGGQDFEQGRAGMQGGHNVQSEGFSQFQNGGNAGYAAEKSANSRSASKDKRKNNYKNALKK